MPALSVAALVLPCCVRRCSVVVKAEAPRETLMLIPRQLTSDSEIKDWGFDPSQVETWPSGNRKTPVVLEGRLQCRFVVCT